MQVLQGMQAKREELEAAEARLAREEEERGMAGEKGKGKSGGSSSPPASSSSRKKKGKKGSGAGGGGGKAGGKGGQQQSPPPEQGEVGEEWQPTARADDEALQETQVWHGWGPKAKGSRALTFVLSCYMLLPLTTA